VHLKGNIYPLLTSLWRPNHSEIMCESVDFIHLVQERVLWQGLYKHSNEILSYFKGCNTHDFSRRITFHGIIIYIYSFNLIYIIFPWNGILEKP
jgi:hypothetical protein